MLLARGSAIRQGPLLDRAVHDFAERLRRAGDVEGRAERKNYREWLKIHSPSMNWDWLHLLLIIGLLDKMTAREVMRALIVLPPRHGKTETVTVRYPVHRMQIDQRTRVILGAYNSTIARKFSRKSRKIARQVGLAISKERAAAEEWELDIAGDIVGGMRAAGFGEGVTGLGADLLVLDDTVKSREEVESPTFREKQWESFTDDFLTRVQTGGQVVATMTRWHHDDLMGRILSSSFADQWTLLHLTALCDSTDDPMGRAIGEVLCSELKTLEELNELRLIMGEYSFSALFQGRPTPRAGGMFPRTIEIVKAVPAGARYARGWDKAGSKDGNGAYTAGVRMAVVDKVYYVVDSRRDRLKAAEREKFIKTAAQEDGHGTSIAVEQEPGSGGLDSADATIQNLAGYTVTKYRATGAKELRADPFASQWQAGNVKLVEGPWNKAYLDEAELFPSGTYKDQIDASALAFKALAEPSSTRGGASGIAL